MPSSIDSSLTQSNLTFFALLLLCFLCFFPNLFHSLWTVPLSIALLPFSHRTPTADANPTATTTPPVPTATMSWSQKQFSLPARSRGSYLITDHVVDALPELRNYKVGLLNLFVQHTSCALSLNENWDEDVRADMGDALDRIAPESGPKGQALYRHDAEGPDDMPVSFSPGRQRRRAWLY
jgi:thiamine phosphate synthase YjbQ (UPF0047 family)